MCTSFVEPEHRVSRKLLERVMHKIGIPKVLIRAVMSPYEMANRSVR